jgi:hypothetical protein
MIIRDMWKTMDSGDKHLILTVFVVPVVAWWVLIGRRKYSGAGMR